MVKVLALVAVMAALVLFGSCSRPFTCEIWEYSVGGGFYYYSYDEEWSGTSADDAEQACDDSYSGYYDCRNCS